MADDAAKFIDAVEEGRIDDVTLYLQNGVNVNTCKPETQDSVLMIACERGHVDIVRLLLKTQNADMTSRNVTGACTLHSAVSRDQIEVLETLIAHGNNDTGNGSGLDLDATDMNGNTALHLAVNKGFIRSTKMLLRNGANANVQERGFRRAPLHDAVRRGDFRTAQMLLEHDANPDAQDVSGATPLHEAVTDNNLHVARLLLKHGASITITENIGGLTPMQAVRSREMRQLLTLFAQRQSRESLRSFDSGNQSLQSSRDNILGGSSHSLHGSRESLFSLPAIKLNENIPYDYDTERRLIRRIRSRSSDRPVLVEFKSGSEKRSKSSSLERVDMHHVDVLDKTQYISRGRRHRSRKRVSLTPHRAHSLESVYDVTKRSIRGHRFSWSPNRGRSRSNSYDTGRNPWTSTRNYVEPVLKPYEMKNSPRKEWWLFDNEYMNPNLDPLEINVVVRQDGATAAKGDADQFSDDESGISSARGSPKQPRHSTPRGQGPPQRSLSPRSRSIAHGSRSSPQGMRKSNPNTGNEFRGNGSQSGSHEMHHDMHQAMGGSHDMPLVHTAKKKRDDRGSNSDSDSSSSSSSSDDDKLAKYEEELKTKKRPVRIYSSIDDLSVVAADGTGLVLKEDELDESRREIIKHKITKLHNRGVERPSLTRSDSTMESDQSTLYGGDDPHTPMMSPVRRHMSDSSSVDVPPIRRQSGDKEQKRRSAEHGTVKQRESEDRVQAEGDVQRSRSRSESSSDSERSPKVMMRSSAEKNRDQPFDDDTVDRSSYYGNMREIRKTFEAKEKIRMITGRMLEQRKQETAIASPSGATSLQHDNVVQQQDGGSVEASPIVNQPRSQLSEKELHRQATGHMARQEAIDQSGDHQPKNKSDSESYSSDSNRRLSVKDRIKQQEELTGKGIRIRATEKEKRASVSSSDEDETRLNIVQPTTVKKSLSDVLRMASSQQEAKVISALKIDQSKIRSSSERKSESESDSSETEKRVSVMERVKQQEKVESQHLRSKPRSNVRRLSGSDEEGTSPQRKERNDTTNKVEPSIAGVSNKTAGQHGAEIISDAAKSRSKPRDVNTSNSDGDSSDNESHMRISVKEMVQKMKSIDNVAVGPKPSPGGIPKDVGRVQPSRLDSDENGTNTETVERSTFRVTLNKQSAVSTTLQKRVTIVQSGSKGDGDKTSSSESDSDQSRDQSHDEQETMETRREKEKRRDSLPKVHKKKKEKQFPLPSDTESAVSHDEYTSLHSSIRGQMYLEQQQNEPHPTQEEGIPRKKGAITPVGTVIRKELEMGRSDSEVEDETRGTKSATAKVDVTHYDAKKPFKAERKIKKTGSVQTTDIRQSGDSNDSSSDDTLKDFEIERPVKAATTATATNGLDTTSDGELSVTEERIVALKATHGYEGDVFLDWPLSPEYQSHGNSLRDVLAHNRAGQSYHVVANGDKTESEFSDFDGTYSAKYFRTKAAETESGTEVDEERIVAVLAPNGYEGDTLLDWNLAPEYQHHGSSLRAAMQNRAHSNQRVANEESVVKRKTTKQQREKRASELESRGGANGTDSELSEVEKQQRLSVRHSRRPEVGSDSDRRRNSSSSPEPEWDHQRNTTHTDDVLLTSQQSKGSRKSSSRKSRGERKTKTATGSKSHKDGATSTSDDEGQQLKGQQTQYKSSSLQTDGVQLESVALSTSMNDSESGTDKLSSVSYGAFDMYEKPPEKVKEKQSSSFWGRICGCCYNVGLY